MAAPASLNRSLAGVAVGGLILIFSAAQRRDVIAQADTSKLTTVLSDLAAATAQDRSIAPATLGGAQALTLDRLPPSVQDAVRGRKLRLDAAGRVQVYILLRAVTDETIAQLTASGVSVEIRDPAHRRVQAEIPVSRLLAVAALPIVDFIRLPSYAVRRTGSVTTEGDSILRADLVRRQFSLDGTGVKVGVISDGIKGIFATGCTSCPGVSGGPIASGDVPNATGTRSASGVLTAISGDFAARSFQANGDLEGLPPPSSPCAFPGAGAEGTAMLEIIHDLAPGAQLAFANADTDLAFNQAVNFLASTNDVVVDDLGFFGEAYDGTSPVSSNTAAALNNGGNRIRGYVTAVGNEADEHYIAPYSDSGVVGNSITGITGTGHLHLFQQSADTTDVLGLGAQPYNVISMPAGGEAAIFLTWDDQFGGSANNYDLYLVRQSTGAVVARSIDVQSGRQDPVEAIDYVNTGAADQFRIVVQNVDNRAAARTLNLFSFEPECAATGPRPLAPPRHERHNYNTATRSVAAEGDAGGSPVSVISVGGICSASAAAQSVFSGSATPDESCNDRSNSTIEFFSSQGPTLDGRTKPDVSAIDGVAVTGAGRFENPFFGTSAAAPHVAAIGALTLQAAPCLIAGAPGALDAEAARSRLRTLIVDAAARLSDSPPDNIFGSGRADALNSVQRTLPVFSGSSAITVSGNTPLGASITPSQLGFTDPNQCGVTRLSWTGGCGTSPGATLDCPFGTTAVSVSGSSNGVAFSSAADIRVTVTSFSVASSPASQTVNAGQSASYQVTLASQGGPFSNAVTLGCANLPAGAACSFNPPAITPGAGSAQSTLTISTNARAAGARLWAISSDRPAGPAVGIFALVLVLGTLSATIRRREGVAFRVLLPAAGLALIAACGGNSGAPPASNPPSNSTAAATVAPGTLTFDSQTLQTTSAPKTVTLTSTGTTALGVSGISVSGDFAQTNTCGASVAVAANCTIAVTFTPTAAGQRSGMLTVADNASNSPQTVTLTGVGANGAVGTPAGTYQVGISGAAGALTQVATVTLVVQ